MSAGPRVPETEQESGGLVRPEGDLVTNPNFPRVCVPYLASLTLNALSIWVSTCVNCGALATATGGMWVHTLTGEPGCSATVSPNRST